MPQFKEPPEIVYVHVSAYIHGKPGAFSPCAAWPSWHKVPAGENTAKEHHGSHLFVEIALVSIDAL